jgi:hypothetical protein
MADWNEILDTQIEPDAPLTAALAAQWRDNHLAVAEGSTGAPRIAHRAMQDSGLIVTVTGTSAIVDLAPIKVLRIYGATRRTGGGGASHGTTIEFSANNGATWSSAVFLVQVPDTDQTSSFDGYLDLDTGAVRAMRSDFVAGSLTLSLFSASTLTVPSGTNAIRLTTLGSAAHGYGVFVVAGRQNF